MSKKNILSKVSDGTKVRVTFQNDDGTRTYEYRGMAARNIQRGRDPFQQNGGKLLKFEPKAD